MNPAMDNIRPRAIRKRNTVYKVGTTIIVRLDRKDGTHYWAEVDADQWQLVRDYRWYVCFDSKTLHILYAAATAIDKTTGTKRTIHLHWALHGTNEPGMVVDHRGGSETTLDCTRSNCRVVTSSINSIKQAVRQRGKKTSRYRGVHWNKVAKKWQACINNAGAKSWVYYGTSEVAAAAAYNTAAYAAWGNEAYLNELPAEIGAVA